MPRRSWLLTISIASSPFRTIASHFALYASVACFCLSSVFTSISSLFRLGQCSARQDQGWMCLTRWTGFARGRGTSQGCRHRATGWLFRFGHDGSPTDQVPTHAQRPEDPPADSQQDVLGSLASAWRPTCTPCDLWPLPKHQRHCAHPPVGVGGLFSVHCSL